MSATTETTTGATDEQIEAAVRRNQRHALGYADLSMARNASRKWAELLVPPDHRITPESDVITPKLREAIRVLREYQMAGSAIETTTVFVPGTNGKEETAEWKEAIVNRRAARDAITPEHLSVIDSVLGQPS